MTGIPKLCTKTLEVHGLGGRKVDVAPTFFARNCVRRTLVRPLTAENVKRGARV